METTYLVRIVCKRDEMKKHTTNVIHVCIHTNENNPWKV